MAPDPCPDMPLVPQKVLLGVCDELVTLSDGSPRWLGSKFMHSQSDVSRRQPEGSSLAEDVKCWDSSFDDKVWWQITWKMTLIKNNGKFFHTFRKFKMELQCDTTRYSLEWLHNKQTKKKSKCWWWRGATRPCGRWEYKWCNHFGKLFSISTKAEHTVVAPYLQWNFPRFQLPVVNCGPKPLHGKFQKETIQKF